MWISDPTPVISSTKTIESWSSWKATSAWNTLPPPPVPGTGIQEYRCWCIVRSAPCLPSIVKNNPAPRAKLASAVRHPSRCPQALLRLPARSRTAAPKSGSPGTSQIELCMFLPARLSVLQQVRVVDRSRAAGTEHGHDDGQPHPHFRGRPHHREESDDPAGEIAVHPGEGHPRQAHGGEHELDAHED